MTVIVDAAVLSMQQETVGMSEACRFMADWTMKQKASCMLDMTVGTTDVAAAALAAMVRIGKVGTTAAPVPPASLNQSS